MEQFFLLSFGMAFGGSRTLRVNHVNPNASSSAVRGAMNGVVASGALYGSRGAAVVPRGAVLVKRSVTVYDVD